MKQTEIKRNLKRVYAVIDAAFAPQCAGCKQRQHLSHTHTISQRRCKWVGKVWLIWDPQNIWYGCLSIDKVGCHEIWDDGTMAEKQKLLNFKGLMAYTKQHDPEEYQRLTV